jgi:hypothetical protein
MRKSSPEVSLAIRLRLTTSRRPCGCSEMCAGQSQKQQRLSPLPAPASRLSSLCYGRVTLCQWTGTQPWKLALWPRSCWPSVPSALSSGHQRLRAQCSTSFRMCRVNGGLLRKGSTDLSQEHIKVNIHSHVNARNSQRKC